MGRSSDAQGFDPRNFGCWQVANIWCCQQHFKKSRLDHTRATSSIQFRWILTGFRLCTKPTNKAENSFSKLKPCCVFLVRPFPLTSSDNISIEHFHCVIRSILGQHPAHAEVLIHRFPASKKIWAAWTCPFWGWRKNGWKSVGKWHRKISVDCLHDCSCMIHICMYVYIYILCKHECFHDYIFSTKVGICVIDMCIAFISESTYVMSFHAMQCYVM